MPFIMAPNRRGGIGAAAARLIKLALGGNYARLSLPSSRGARAERRQTNECEDTTRAELLDRSSLAKLGYHQCVRDAAFRRPSVWVLYIRMGV